MNKQNDVGGVEWTEQDALAALRFDSDGSFGQDDVDQMLRLMHHIEMMRSQKCSALLASPAPAGEGAAVGECEYEFTVSLDGEFAAGGFASTAALVLSEAGHYAAQYALDGVVDVEFSIKRPISRKDIEALAAPTGSTEGGGV